MQPCSHNYRVNRVGKNGVSSAGQIIQISKSSHKTKLTHRFPHEMKVLCSALPVRGGSVSVVGPKVQLSHRRASREFPRARSDVGSVWLAESMVQKVE